jgi:hypothetical protein
MQREFREDLAATRERLGREQMLRERNARHTIATLDALVDEVRGLDTRVAAVEDS